MRLYIVGLIFFDSKEKMKFVYEIVDKTYKKMI